eukprot:1314604-Amorphochlora_amoeboformis.AAC.1
MGLRSGPIFRALRGRNLRHSQGKTLRYMSQSKAVNYDDFIRPHAKVVRLPFRGRGGRSWYDTMGIRDTFHTLEV